MHGHMKGKTPPDFLVRHCIVSSRTEQMTVATFASFFPIPFTEMRPLISVGFPVTGINC